MYNEDLDGEQTAKVDVNEGKEDDNAGDAIEIISELSPAKELIARQERLDRAANLLGKTA